MKLLRLVAVVATLVVIIWLIAANANRLSKRESPVTESAASATLDEASPNNQGQDDLEQLKTAVSAYLKARWSFSCTDTIEARKQQILETGVVADPAMLDDLALEIGTTRAETECVEMSGSSQAIAYPDRLLPGHFEAEHADITMSVAFTMRNSEDGIVYGPTFVYRTVICEKIDGKWLIVGEI